MHKTTEERISITETDVIWMKQSIEKIDKNVELLLQFKWKLAGSTAALCILVSLVFELVKASIIK